jgi:hypothetical protein
MPECRIVLGCDCGPVHLSNLPFINTFVLQSTHTRLWLVWRLPESSDSNIWFRGNRNTESLFWRGPAAKYWTGLGEVLRRNKRSVYRERQTPFLEEAEVRPHFQTRSYLGGNKNLDHRSRWDLQPRMTVLTRPSSNLTDRPICNYKLFKKRSWIEGNLRRCVTYHLVKVFCDLCKAIFLRIANMQLIIIQNLVKFWNSWNRIRDIWKYLKNSLHYSPPPNTRFLIWSHSTNFISAF